MRFAVISDIHANLRALTEVLGAIEARRSIASSLGDIVGYGASPNACCDLVRSVAESDPPGNHDAAVAGRMDYSFITRGRGTPSTGIRGSHRGEPRLAQKPALHLPEWGDRLQPRSPIDPRAYEYMLRPGAEPGS